MKLSSTQITSVKKSSLILRAINHPLRRNLLEIIGESKEPVTVTELYIRLRLEQSVCSQHLAILRKANIVSTVRDGKYIKYKVNNDIIDKLLILCEDINSLSNK
jgi:DNA-binding transcriptional ArsR family regulator